MIRDAAVSLIAARVGQRVDLNPIIILEMDLAIRTKLEESAKLIPWFLTTEMASTTTTIDDERLPLPTDFIIEVESGTLWIKTPDETKWTRLKKTDYDNLDEKFEDDGLGRPTHYAIAGLYFMLRPVPDIAYNVRMRYAGKDPQSVATSNVENLWLKYASDLVIAATCAEVARGQIHDFQLAASFAPEIASAWDRLRVLNEARQHANQDYQMGDD